MDCVRADHGAAPPCPLSFLPALTARIRESGYCILAEVEDVNDKLQELAEEDEQIRSSTAHTRLWTTKSRRNSTAALEMKEADNVERYVKEKAAEVEEQTKVRLLNLEFLSGTLTDLAQVMTEIIKRESELESEMWERKRQRWAREAEEREQKQARYGMLLPLCRQS
jgi:hypothetical protein